MPSEDWEDDPLNNLPTTPSPSNPFGVEAIDPLVYRKVDDIPELRESAKRVLKKKASVHIRDARPVPPTPKSYTPWTPGAEDSYEEELEKEPPAISAPVKFALLLVISLIPLVGGWFLIQWALDFYK